MVGMVAYIADVIQPRLVTSAKQLLDPHRTQRITGGAFQISSFHLDWQIDHGVFNTPIIARSQILVNS